MEHSPHCQRPFWECLTVSERAALVEVGIRSVFPAGSTVLDRNDASGDVVILWSGLVKAVAQADASTYLVLALRGNGEIVGELGHVRGGRRTATVVAIDKVEALSVPNERFMQFLGGSTNAAGVLQRTVVDRLCEADRDRLAVASMTVGQRLARLLIKLVQRYGVPTPDGGVTVSRLSQRELAACVGGARSTVVRELARWRDRHIISTTWRSMTVHQSEVLARIAGQHAPRP